MMVSQQNVNKMLTKCQQNVNKMSTKCQQNVNKMNLLSLSPYKISIEYVISSSGLVRSKECNQVTGEEVDQEDMGIGDLR